MQELTDRLARALEFKTRALISRTVEKSIASDRETLDKLSSPTWLVRQTHSNVFLLREKPANIHLLFVLRK